MDPITADPVASLAAESARAASEPPAPSELGREDFLRLLIAQLENQDPMNPSKDKEFIAQLATFSSLEQLIAANDNLLGIAAGQASLINAQALSLIGKEALVEAGDEIRISAGKPDDLVYILPRPAQSAELTIYASDGSVLRVLELERTPGRRITLDWDGTDQDGNPLPDGEYRYGITARDLEGDPMSIAQFQSIPIDGVNFGNEGIALVSGDQEIPFELILEIRAGQPQG